MEQNKDRLARILSEEEGKPLSEARGEIDFGASCFTITRSSIAASRAKLFRPIARMSRSGLSGSSGRRGWHYSRNYPSAVAVRKIAPALIAGNTIVLKPHEDTPLSALELAKLGEEAGIPAGVVNVVTGPGETVGESLVTSPIPRLISFTGSVATGKHIMRNAADHVTAISLELGGKAQFIVMDDTDLDAAVRRRFLAVSELRPGLYLQRTDLRS